MHLLPRVREIEDAYPDDLVVIGVHAGKYPAERVTERLARACERLRVRHAVVNDRQYRIWRSYGVQAWPTLALVSPEGRLLAVRAGEGAADEVLSLLRKALGAAPVPGTTAGAAHGAPRDGQAPPAASDPSLRFPARVLSAGGRLYVSDSGHDRVLELELAPEAPAARPRALLRRAWGGATTGMADGSADACSFDEPQGLALIGQTLYVADRGNHAVRAIDLAGGGVVTVAGTGRLAPGALRPGPPTSTDLRSPWGLAVHEDALVVAMAGAHQLWRLDITGAKLAPVAGTGGEDIVDGPAGSALLAQPTGVATGDGSVFFADSESSSVRELLPGPRPAIRTLVGTGLFDFGDRDGEGDEVRLQHAEDVAVHAGEIYVADTYNDRIKALDPDTRACRSLPGPAGDGTALTAPAGIASFGKLLLVADTDAHRLVVVDPADGSVTPVEMG
jgi:DNA-binding beta-propeller fold protein YncE